MGPIDDLDDKKRSISSIGWRILCFGWNEAKNQPSGSDTTWSEWRTIAGVDKDTRGSMTQREAFLIFVLSRFKSVCADIKAKDPKFRKPTIKSKKPGGKSLDIFALEAIANKWVMLVSTGDTWGDALKYLAGKDGMSGEELAVLLGEWLGKRSDGTSKSRRTIYRRCAQSGVPLSLKKKYSSAQIQKLFNATFRSKRQPKSQPIE
jgi:hypothetical protein